MTANNATGWYRQLRKSLSPLRARATKIFKRVRADLFPGRYLSEIVRINGTNIDNPRFPVFDDYTNYQVHAEAVEGQIADDYHLRYLSMATELTDGHYRRGDVFTCEIKNARLHIPTGATTTPDNRFLMESALAPGRLQLQPIYQSPVPRNVPRLTGTYSTIWTVTANNYYHWLVECLPRLYSLQQVGKPITLLMPSDLPPVWQEMLDICLPENVTVEHPQSEWVEVENFVLSNCVTFKASAFIPPPHLDYVRKRFFAAYDLPPEPEPKHNIYITRKHARKRFVLNEDEVLDYLSQFGFEPYALEHMSYREQVTLLHGAKNIVAPHGAGNTNILFSGPITLLEFINAYPKPHFYLMTHALGQQFYWILAGERHINSDLSVDMAQLKHYVALMMDGDSGEGEPT